MLVPSTVGAYMVYVGSTCTLSEKSHCTQIHTLIAGQLEAALALANQRIAELEALVKALQDTVQGLEEALAAAHAQAATLQVLLYLHCACNVHKSRHLALTNAQRICCSHSVTIMVAGRLMQAALSLHVRCLAACSSILHQQLTADLAFLVMHAQ